MFTFFNHLTLGEFGGVGLDDWTFLPGREAESPPPPTASPPVAETTVQVGWLRGMVRRWMVRGVVFHRWLSFFFLKSRSMLGSSSKYRGSFVTFLWCGMIQWFVMSF